MPSITQPTAPCHVPADAAEEVLLGVDTHKDVHAAAIVTVLGTELDSRSFPTTAEGYRQLVAWARWLWRSARMGCPVSGSQDAR
ncbi:hypothetical protein ACIRU3_45370 [Streptomyces sp. NPDC101151]|uniref:hypothetical protein n=1 Tax=Streptomyces sp. NPDC101151 TaxID=3366115 RepID=UPI003829A539